MKQICKTLSNKEESQSVDISEVR